MAITRRREDVRTTMVSRTEITHSEHGLTPSTKPMITVDINRDWSSRDTVPTNGTSISAPVSFAEQVSSSWSQVPVPGDPYTPEGTGTCDQDELTCSANETGAEID